MVAHQNTLVDVVRRVDRRERRRDGDPNAAPLLGLNRGLPRAADALAKTRDDHFEVPVDEGIALEEALTVDDQAGISVSGQILGAVGEADPGRRHGVRVDVVEEIVDGQIRHAQIELALELPADEVRVFGQEQHPLTGCQLHGF